MPEDRNTEQELYLGIESLLEETPLDLDKLQEVVQNAHPADVADVIEELSEEMALKLIERIPHDLISDVISELETSVREDLINQMDLSLVAFILHEVPSDDAVDIFSEIEDNDKKREILKKLPNEDSLWLQELILHKEDTAGGIMAKEIISLPAQISVEKTIEVIRRVKDEVEDLYNIYVIGKDRKLIGYVNLMDLVTSSPTRKLGEIMNDSVISVYSDMDQEEVANIARKYDMVSVPVVDREGRLEGRITVDDIMDVMEEEQIEDISRMTGTSEDEVYEDSSFKISMLRLPWLITALIGEIIAAFVISRYEGEITDLAALPFFIPVITAMGGNVGMQSAAIVVRGLATGEVLVTRIMLRLFREMKVSFLNGFVLSATLMFIIYQWMDNPTLCFIVGLGLFVVVVFTTLSGAFFPIMLKKINIDPAVATGPFITTSNDVVGLIIYFSIAKIFL